MTVLIEGKDKYEFTHGRKPRGLGSWAFKIGSNDEIFWTPVVLFSAACKLAKVEAKRQGAYSVEVLT